MTTKLILHGVALSPACHPPALTGMAVSGKKPDTEFSGPAVIRIHDVTGSFRAHPECQ